jgi:hypothetical protein
MVANAVRAALRRGPHLRRGRGARGVQCYRDYATPNDERARHQHEERDGWGREVARTRSEGPKTKMSDSAGSRISLPCPNLLNEAVSISRNPITRRARRNSQRDPWARPGVWVVQETRRTLATTSPSGMLRHTSAWPSVGRHSGCTGSGEVFGRHRSAHSGSCYCLQISTFLQQSATVWTTLGGPRRGWNDGQWASLRGRR